MAILLWVHRKHLWSTGRPHHHERRGAAYQGSQWQSGVLREDSC